MQPDQLAGMQLALEGGMMHKDHEIHRRRRSRNLGLLVVLLAFIALLFWVTIAKMGINAGNPWG